MTLIKLNDTGGKPVTSSFWTCSINSIIRFCMVWHVRLSSCREHNGISKLHDTNDKHKNCHKVWQRSTHACPPSIYQHGASSPLQAALQWHSCVRAILHCWTFSILQPICTASDVETPPLVHIAMVLMRRQNIWCYTAQHLTRRGSHGQISTIKATQDTYGASWRGSGWWPVPPTGNERQRESAKTSVTCSWN